MSGSSTTDSAGQKAVWLTGEEWVRLVGILDDTAESVISVSRAEARALADAVRAQIERLRQ